MTRPSNKVLRQSFRNLLTEGAKLHFNDNQLVLTKAYRNDIWKAFKEIEERLCPISDAT